MAPAITFALFASLLASEVWLKAAAIKAEMITEVSALRSVHRLAKVLQVPDHQVKNKAEIYIQTLVNEQVARGHNDAKVKEESQHKASNLLDEFYNVAVASDKIHFYEPAATVFLTELTKLRDSRLRRIALEDAHIAPIKLAVLLLFGFITQITIGLCHSGDTRAVYWSIGLFSIAFSLAVGIITLFDHPVNASHLVFIDLALRLWMAPK